MVAEISWTHNPILIEKYKIESETYERYILNQTNFDKALDDKDSSQDINPKIHV